MVSYTIDEYVAQGDAVVARGSWPGPTRKPGRSRRRRRSISGASRTARRSNSTNISIPRCRRRGHLNPVAISLGPAHTIGQGERDDGNIRAFRRPHRRRRALRHRRGLSSAAEVPGQELRHSRGPRLHRRHLGSVSLSRHPLRQRHVHARLFVQAVDRAEGDRRRAEYSQLCAADRRRERHRQEDPLQPPRQARVVVVAGCALDRGGRAQGGRGRHRDRALHLQFPVHVLGLLQIRGRLHAGICGLRGFRRPHRASAEMARRYRLCRQARGGDRLGRDRGDAGAGDGQDRRPRHHAAAFADLCGGAAGGGCARQQAAAQSVRQNSPIT